VGWSAVANATEYQVQSGGGATVKWQRLLQGGLEGNPYRFTDPDWRQDRAAERFSDAYASDPKAFEPFEPIAIQVTATAIALTPFVGPILTLSFRTAARNAEQPAASAPKGDPHAPGDAPNGAVIVRAACQRHRGRNDEYL